MFDEDAGGFIDSVEVEKLVVALLQLTEIEVDKEKTEVCVEVRERNSEKNILAMQCQALLEALDEDGNGQISKEEFVNNALHIDFISGILSNDEENKN